jgi:hypothetical protein
MPPDLLEEKNMRWLWLAAVTLVLALGGAVVAGSSGCDEGDCLVYDENCSAAYKQANYGTTDIWCCTGSCQKNFYGDQVCR